MSHNYTKIFPYKEIRKEQKLAIDFGLKSLIDSNKKSIKEVLTYQPHLNCPFRTKP